LLRPLRSDLSSWGPILIIAVALLLVSALHYGTPRDPSYHGLHDVWRRLYYVPIVLGAFHYGLKGGLITSILATLCYLPHVVFQWGGMASGDRYLEMIMFNLIGAVTGLLAEELHRKTEEARRAYQQLAESFERTKEAERLAAMGQLSASLAHEIRNPLASIKGSLPILLEGIDAADPRREFAGICEKELGRLEELTGQFLEYARPPRPHLALDELQQVTASVVRLVQKQALHNRVEVDLKVEGQPPRLRMDSNRMRQVILNLVLNAIEAMPGGGRLRLRVFQETTGKGKFAVLKVEDSGSGVDPSVAQHIFEPFVTTKAKGTGLGLAVAHGWVTRHGGTLEFTTSELGGACFVVRLPVSGAAGASFPEDRGAGRSDRDEGT